VRQLENLCNWITVMAPGQTVEIKDLPAELIQSTGTVPISSAPSAPAVATLSSTPLSSTPFSTEPSVTARLNGDHHAPMTLATETHANGSSVNGSAASDSHSWLMMLEAEASQMLSSGKPEVMDALGRQFEAALIKAALKHTHGRKNDAAIRLGIGRNTITRKIQELGIAGTSED